MVKINSHFLRVKRPYIFPIIEEKLSLHQGNVLNLGIGDVSRPLHPQIVDAITDATKELKHEETMRGYGPSIGYPFLREAIAQKVYHGLEITPDEIFISDGINPDIANILEIFDESAKVAVQDPTYPLYLDGAILSGKSQILFLPCNESNGFVCQPPNENVDLIFLCNPNNPTGTALTHKHLKKWIEYAKRERAVILYDGAYAEFITSLDVPKSIYEVQGAKEVALEFRSFSKFAGFTGLRCSYTVIPKNVQGFLQNHGVALNALWKQRQNTKFNGVAYPIQRGALVALNMHKELLKTIDAYLKSAKILIRGLENMGFMCVGGVDCPYIWCKSQEFKTSWDFFDDLLEKARILSVPGIGFGQEGEGFVRFSSFISEGIATEAIKRMKNALCCNK